MSDSPAVALVSGASGHVGRAVVAQLAARGVQVVALDRVAPQHGHAAALALTGVDLLDPTACEASVAEVLARFGRLDMVAHTVGAFAMSPMAETSPAHWQQMLDINLISTVNLYRAALRPMQAARRGSLVAIGAMAALSAPAEMAAYAAAKAGVLKLTESLAAELRPHGVRVNAVLPGTIDTAQNRAAMPEADPSRWLKPKEVAEAMVFLLSDEASGISGALLPVTARG